MKGVVWRKAIKADLSLAKKRWGVIFNTILRILTLFLFFNAAYAGMITPVERESHLHTFSEFCALGDGSNCGNITEDKANFQIVTPYNNRFNQSLGGASQDSFFTSNLINAQVGTDTNLARGEFGKKSDSSSFHFVFTLNESVPYTLTGEIDILTYSPNPTGHARVSLQGPGTNLNFSETESFDLTGVFQPGQYTFSVKASSRSNSFEAGAATASARLALVPIAPAIWLFSTAFLGLFGIAKRNPKSI
jgi:hypothetical protein